MSSIYLCLRVFRLYQRYSLSTLSSEICGSFIGWLVAGPRRFDTTCWSLDSGRWRTSMDESFGRRSGRITLEWIMQKLSGKVSVSSIWLRNDFSDELLWTRWWTFVQHVRTSGFSRTLIHGIKFKWTKGNSATFLGTMYSHVHLLCHEDWVHKIVFVVFCIVMGEYFGAVLYKTEQPVQSVGVNSSRFYPAQHCSTCCRIPVGSIQRSTAVPAVVIPVGSIQRSTAVPDVAIPAGSIQRSTAVPPVEFQSVLSSAAPQCLQ